MRKFFIITFLLAALVSCGLVWLYFDVDARVRARLAAPPDQGLSAIYSDVTRLEPETPPDFVELQLVKHRYRAVTSAPEHPGEYHRGGDSFQIFTREFLSPDGSISPSVLVTWTPHDRNSGKVLLEAQVISVLGEGGSRASEQRNLKDFPAFLVQAVVSIEDERFRHHHGVDLEGVFRALIRNLIAMRIVQGGSTITQQLAKNLLFSHEKSIKRKVLEALAAFSLERHLSKERILEMYFNEVYLGQEGSTALHGFESASRSFFGKRVQDLSIAEAAMLAGIIQAPSLYSPRRYPARARERRDIVLKKMRTLDYLTADQLRTALATPINVIKDTLHRRRAPHFTTEMAQQLETQIGTEIMQQPGISIFTGLDLDLQQCAEHAIRKQLPALEKQFPKIARKQHPLEVGLVSLEPFSGKVRAWVGGRDFIENQFDHVAKAHRQIGSTIKPFLYLTALDGSLNHYKVATPLSILSDEPLRVNLVTQNSWEPENYDREFRGDVTVRYALENSLNIPAVNVMERIGLPSFVKTLQRFRVASHIPEVPALALGALDTSLIELTSAFGGIANGGVYVSPRPILSVFGAENNRLFSSEIIEERVADEAATFVLTNILEGVIARGTGRGVRSAGYTLPVAGKTGTSNEARDLWFVGYSPDLVTGVWLGYDDNGKVGLTGGSAAVPVWTEYMKCASLIHPPADFIAPRGVVFADVDPRTGFRVSPECPSSEVIREVFVSGTEPSLRCQAGKSAPSYTNDDSADEITPKRKRSFWESIFGE